MSNRKDILKGIINLSKNNIEKLKIQNTKLIPLVTKKYDVRLKGDLKNEKILSLY